MYEWDGYRESFQDLAQKKKMLKKNNSTTKLKNLQIDSRQELTSKKKYDSQLSAMVKKITAGSLALSLGYGFFKTLPFIMLLKIPMLIAITLLGYFTIIKFIFPIHKKPDIIYTANRIKLPNSVNKKEFIEKLTNAENKINRLEELIKRKNLRIFKIDIDHICLKARTLIDEVIDNPTLITNVRNHIGYYLDALISILERFDDIGVNLEKNEQIEKILQNVKNAFDKKFEVLSRQEIRELDADIYVLENQLKQIGT